MNMTTGFRARRLMLGLTMDRLSRECGLSLYIIRRCEEGEFDSLSMDSILTLAHALDLSVSEGCALITCPGDRQRPRRCASGNPIESYMLHHGLTLRGMALLLNVSVQTVNKQCSLPTPAPRYIKALADSECMSVGDFQLMYGALAAVEKGVSPCM